MTEPDHVCSVGRQPRRTNAGKASSRPPTTTRLSGSPFFEPSLLVDAAGQRLERRSERGVIGVVHDLPGRIDLAPEHVARVVVGAEAGHEREDREGSRAPVGDQVELHELHTLVEVGQHESRARGAGRNRIAERELAKAPVELGARARRLRPRPAPRPLRRRERSSDPAPATAGSRRGPRGSRLRSRPAGSTASRAARRRRRRSRRRTAPRSTTRTPPSVRVTARLL